MRQKSYRLATLFAMCSLCHTPAAQVLTRVRTYVTLFFLPVAPVSNRYQTTCTMCGGGVKLTKEAADQLLATVQAAPAPGPMPEALTPPPASPPSLPSGGAPPTESS